MSEVGEEEEECDNYDPEILQLTESQEKLRTEEDQQQQQMQEQYEQLLKLLREK